MELTGEAAAGLKRTGRPVHPLWAHFHRGEKRNRYHYHAYCSFCVERMGAGQVAPTRGVSSDMLRHLESCPNCPRKVVESLRDICGRRAKSAQARKQALAAEFGDSRLDDQVLLLTPAPETVAATEMTTQNEAAKALEAALDRSPVDAIAREDGRDKKVTAKRHNSSGYSTAPKRSCPDNSNDGKNEEDAMEKWQISLLQAAVMAGIPLDAFKKTEFQELLHLLSPVLVDNDDVINKIASQTFVADAAAKLARAQLDRVKEGMSNSTIKSGLTLSVTCWRTLDLQQLVAFTLVNANGDAACVGVEDIGGQHCSEGYCDSPAALLTPITNAIEDVLLELSKKEINVIGIVADSVAALSAVQKVASSTRWRSLLVVPCLSALLASLAGTVLTDDVFRDAVGKLVEVAAYFSNARLKASLATISGESSVNIPLPTKEHWCSFVACLTKTLHYSDAITAMCSSQEGENSMLAPQALRELILENNGQLWKILRKLLVLLAPLREAYSLAFQPNPTLGEARTADDNDRLATTVQGGLTLAHVMYQLGRMSQQYGALAESAEISDVPAASEYSCIGVVAHKVHDLLELMWQRYDMPAMVLAFVFDFHLDTGRLDMSNSALGWKAVTSYFELYFQRWFSSPTSGSDDSERIPKAKLEHMFNAYQLRQFPFDAGTTNDYTDVSSFYSFISESHSELCALCCRVYAIALACADVRHFVQGVGLVPNAATTIERPEHVEYLLHIGFASSVNKTRINNTSIPPEFIQASRPSSLLCSHDEWELLADDWKNVLDQERAIDEIDQLQRLRSQDSNEKDDGGALHVRLDQVFFEGLPPLPSAVVVAPSPHDPTGAVTQASVAL